MSNTNESGTIPILQKFLELNKALAPLCWNVCCSQGSKKWWNFRWILGWSKKEKKSNVKIEKKTNVKIGNGGCSTVWSGSNVVKCFFFQDIRWLPSPNSIPRPSWPANPVRDDLILHGLRSPLVLNDSAPSVHGPLAERIRSPWWND